MIRYLSILLLLALITGCKNTSTSSIAIQTAETQDTLSVTPDPSDQKFADFIEKFSADSTFQLSRTKFPLKVTWYDHDTDQDSLFFINKPDFQMVDLRKKKSSGEFDQWEASTVLSNNKTSATIRISGIDNGIMVFYHFEKINGAWMLVDVEDAST